MEVHTSALKLFSERDSAFNRYYIKSNHREPQLITSGLKFTQRKAVSLLDKQTDANGKLPQI